MKLTERDVAYLYPTQVQGYNADEVITETVWCETRVTGNRHHRKIVRSQRVTISLYSLADWDLLDELNKVWRLTDEQVEVLRNETGNARSVIISSNVSHDDVTEETVTTRFESQHAGVFKLMSVVDRHGVVTRGKLTHKIVDTPAKEPSHATNDLSVRGSGGEEEEPFLDTSSLAFRLCSKAFRQKLLTHQVKEATRPSTDTVQGGLCHREKFTQRAGGTTTFCPPTFDGVLAVCYRDAYLQRPKGDSASDTQERSDRSTDRVSQDEGHASTSSRSPRKERPTRARKTGGHSESKNRQGRRTKARSLPKVSSRIIALRVNDVPLSIT